MATACTQGGCAGGSTPIRVYREGIGGVVACLGTSLGSVVTVSQGLQGPLWAALLMSLRVLKDLSGQRYNGL